MFRKAYFMKRWNTGSILAMRLIIREGDLLYLDDWRSGSITATE